MDTARLRRDLAHFGVFFTIWRRVGNLAERFLGLQVYSVTLRRTAGLAPLVPPPDGFTFVEATRDRLLGAVASQTDLDLTAAVVNAAFDRGDRCWIALRDDRVVSYNWSCTSGCTPHQDYVAVAYPPGSCYACGLYTAPSARGSRIAFALSHHILHVRAGEGFAKELGMTALHNVSMRSRRKYPWSKTREDGTPTPDCGWAGYVRWGSKVWCWRSPGAAREGFRFVPTRDRMPT